jgi:putative tryptophan/tyrosine transport system substrate-binding protein
MSHAGGKSVDGLPRAWYSRDVGAHPPMTRLVAVLVAVLMPVALGAAPAGSKLPRVGYLAEDGGVPAAFTQTLRELGDVDGQSIRLESRSAAGHPERLSALAQELVGLDVAVLVAGGIRAAHAAETATTSIPIVLAGIGNPIGSATVGGQPRPGGNVVPAGVFTADLAARQVALIREMLPAADRIGVLLSRTNVAHNPSFPALAPFVKGLSTAGDARGIKVLQYAVKGPGELASVFTGMARDRARALVVASDAMFFDQRQTIADLAQKARMPTVFGERVYTEAGGLIAYGPRYDDLDRRAARLTDRILKGAKPTDLAVDPPRGFELSVNLKTAEAIGLTLPDSLRPKAGAPSQ